jgi:hypothetical protein
MNSDRNAKAVTESSTAAVVSTTTTTTATSTPSSSEECCLVCYTTWSAATVTTKGHNNNNNNNNKHDRSSSCVGITPCSHNEICGLCHLRLRHLHEDYSCPICKVSNDMIVVDYYNNSTNNTNTNNNNIHTTTIIALFQDPKVTRVLRNIQFGVKIWDRITFTNPKVESFFQWIIITTPYNHC